MMYEFREIGVLDTPSRERLDDHSLSVWLQVLTYIADLQKLEDDWDGEGASRVSDEMLISTFRLAMALMETGNLPPQIVSPFPDGNTNLEWHHSDGTIERIEVDGLNRGELMVTYPDRKRSAKFSPLAWSTRAIWERRDVGMGVAFVKTVALDLICPNIPSGEGLGVASGWDNFQMAA